MRVLFCALVIIYFRFQKKETLWGFSHANCAYMKAFKATTQFTTGQTKYRHAMHILRDTMYNTGINIASNIHVVDTWSFVGLHIAKVASIFLLH